MVNGYDNHLIHDLIIDMTISLKKVLSAIDDINQTDSNSTSVDGIEHPNQNSYMVNACPNV